MSKNMKIGWRLGLGFTLVLILMVTLILVGLYNMKDIFEKMEHITNVINVRTQKANDMIGEVREVSIALRNLFLTKDPAEISQLKDRITTFRKEYDEEFKKVEELTVKEDVKGYDLISKIKVLQDSSRKLNNRVIEVALSNKTEEAALLMNKEARPAVRKWVEAVEELIRHQEERGKVHYDEAVKAYESTRTYMYTIGAIAIALSVVIAMFLTLSITRPLGLGVNLANRIASGDLSGGVSADNRRDEIGVLFQAFQKMSENLREQIKGIIEGANSLASSASEILATTTQLASSSAETASSVSETMATVEEVKQAAQVSSEKSKNVSEVAQTSASVAQQGKAAVAQTVEGINRIREQMESVGQSIVKLSEQSQAIGEIITAVDDLAQQSNLLAVNAAIEAAKAGEQGKGFAVVAQEVKSMADQSKHATEQVRAILSDIQKATSGAVMATEQVSNAVETGVKQAAESGGAIGRLAESITEAAQASVQIMTSNQQQSLGMDQIVSAMENIKQAAQQNMAGTKQAELAAHNLNELGQKFKTMVERYRI